MTSLTVTPYMVLTSAAVVSVLAVVGNLIWLALK